MIDFTSSSSISSVKESLSELFVPGYEKTVRERCWHSFASAGNCSDKLIKKIVDGDMFPKGGEFFIEINGVGIHGHAVENDVQITLKESDKTFQVNVTVETQNRVIKGLRLQAHLGLPHRRPLTVEGKIDLSGVNLNSCCKFIHPDDLKDADMSKSTVGILTLAGKNLEGADLPKVTSLFDDKIEWDDKKIRRYFSLSSNPDSLLKPISSLDKNRHSLTKVAIIHSLIDSLTEKGFTPDKLTAVAVNIVSELANEAISSDSKVEAWLDALCLHYQKNISKDGRIHEAMGLWKVVQ